MEIRNSEQEKTRIIQPGKNCWVYEMATHGSLLVDGAEYFSAFSQAILSARKTVYISAWDIKTYTLIKDPEQPEKVIPLIALFQKALHRSPKLNIYVLCWNWTSFFAHDREFCVRWKWGGHPRLHFSLDSNHPLGACHHQKLVVVDEALGFCGGIDITDHRWDTPDHRSLPNSRRDHRGKSYKPYHDVQMAVGGQAAAALGDLFRERWRLSTGQRIASHNPSSYTWPTFLRSDISQVRVAIARTVPGEIHEVAALNRDAISSAEEYIYIENQYLSCRFIVDLLKKKLMQKEGPEVLIVLPKRYPGLMERTAIGPLTLNSIAKLRSADHFHRLGIFYPETSPSSDHQYIIVHSKVLIVDGKFLRIGSSNFSERSMAVDTECDLAVEYLEDRATREAIEAFFFRLLAEHNSCPISEVRFQFLTHPSILRALEELRRRRTSRLELFEASLKKSAVSRMMRNIVDPKHPWRDIFLNKVKAIPQSRLNFLKRAVVLILLAVALSFIFNMLQNLKVEDLGEALQSLSSDVILMSLLLVPVDYLLLAGIDTLSLRYFQEKLAFWKIFSSSFISYAFNFNLGPLIGGIAFRYRIYSLWGLRPDTITGILALSIASNWIGYAAVLGFAFFSTLFCQ